MGERVVVLRVTGMPGEAVQRLLDGAGLARGPDYAAAVWPGGAVVLVRAGAAPRAGEALLRAVAEGRAADLRAGEARSDDIREVLSRAPDDEEVRAFLLFGAGWEAEVLVAEVLEGTYYALRHAWPSERREYEARGAFRRGGVVVFVPARDLPPGTGLRFDRWGRP